MRDELRTQTEFGIALLRVMPWSISFHERIKLFREIVDADRVAIQGSDDVNSGTRSRGIVVRIRRSRILEDGKIALDRVGHSIKDRIVVRYVDAFGEEEAGIDAGGLFKDFWTSLSVRVFDPSFGLFEEKNQLTYPNPAASKLYDEYEMANMYTFLGKILGKALYENIVVQPQFAHFFLSFLGGRYNFMNLIDDLSTLDPDLYKNLMFLKTFDGNVADLDLTFSVMDDSFGSQTEIELIPGGKGISVTSSNKHRYINAVAKHYLHDRLQRQAGAFFAGLYQIIQPELLNMFCAPELQVLISGAVTGISIVELRNYSRYAGGYSSIDHRIGWFWNIVGEFSDADKALLLKFVTSCERPPSLGFDSLQPPFTIQRVDCTDDSRLPTSSTCFNTLKLPTYTSSAILKAKLLLSIRSGAGFDLT